MEKTNIFEGAKFGDKFTVGIPELNGKAVLIGHNKNGYICAVSFGEELKSEDYVYNSNGNMLSGSDLRYDIVSKYTEPIDENKLDEFAEEYYDSEIYQPSQAVFENGKLIKCADVDDNGEPYLSEFSVIQAYKAGYMKAKEEI